VILGPEPEARLEEGQAGVAIVSRGQLFVKLEGDSSWIAPVRLCSDVDQNTIPVMGWTWVIRRFSGMGRSDSSAGAVDARPGMSARVNSQARERIDDRT
jgi:hypothetical protein